MVMLLLAAAAPVLLACETTIRSDPAERRLVAQGGAAPLIITLDVEQRRIASVLVEGAPRFSSYRPVAPRQLLPRSLQWRGRFQGEALRLRREGMDMVLEPARDAPGACSGFWTQVVTMANRRIEVNGMVTCTIVAGALTEGAST
jgi:hypothetical protein